MKNIFFLLLTILLITPRLYAQQVTYNGKNVPLKTVFSIIQKQTGYGFFYDQKVLSTAKPVTIHVTKLAIKDVLTIVFKNQPLSYTINNKTILISGKKQAGNSALKSTSKSKKATPKVAVADKSANDISNQDLIDVTAKLDSATVLVNNAKSVAEKSEPEIKSSGAYVPSGPVSVNKNPANSQKVTNTPFETKSPGALKSAISFFKSFVELQPELSNYGEVTFGVKGGFTSSRRNWASAGSGSNDFYLGFFTNKQMSSKVHLGTELSFSLLGENTQFALPVHLKYAVNNRLTLLAGPVVDLMGERYSRKYVGLSAEAGGQYQLNQIFFAETRYGIGVLNQNLNILRVGIGAHFTRKESVETRTNEPEPLRLRIGLNGGIALNDPYVSVAGVDLRIQEYFTNKVAGTITAGYNQYWWKNESRGYMGYFPMKGGLKYYAAKPFYISSEAGFAFGTGSEQTVRPFLYAAGVGVELKNGLDLSLRYENLTGNLYKFYYGQPDMKRPAHVSLRAEYGVNFKPVKKEPGEFREAKEQPAWRGTRKKSLFLEAGGHGIGVSGIFDMRFKPNQNDGLGFSTGVGFASETLTLPLSLNYIVGKRRSGFEAGIGVTALINKYSNENFFWGSNEDDERFMAAGVVTVGYRLQSYNGLMLRANFSAVYDGLYYGKFFREEGLFYPHTPGISVGYTFR